ncbi:30S ribosomal protein S8, partial [Candidatus Nomurabacteria bacterium CG_4_9_14_0_2_um_filter_32_10]
VKGGIGMTIVSTSKGVMSGTDAKNKKLGGEIICQIW